ncbi:MULTISPECIES: O-antigen ligase [unclassified Roseateles]|uniref:O-antigen ligase family protein n=1 Tax=unclassified Roseateles TaxID=2626991 RepID=UPI0009EBBD74|nr:MULTISPECIES: O-antigen ligase family protein [unclassified Roseateles]
MNLKLNFPDRPQAILALLRAAKYGVLLVFTVLCGMAVVVLPPGLTVRAFAALGVLTFLAFAWGYPSLPGREPPNRILKLIASLMFLFAIIWPQYIFLSVASLPRVNPFTLGSFLFLALVAVISLHYRSFSAELGRGLASVRGLLIVYVCWMCWRVVTSAVVDFPVSRILEIFREFVFIHSAFFVGLILSRSDGWRERLNNLLICASLVVAAAGIVEAIEQRNRFVAFASADEAGQLGSVIANIASEKLRSGTFRVQSVFGHPILFGQFLGAMLPLLFAAFVSRSGIIYRGLIIAVTLLCLVGIWKSGSRSGVLAAVTSVAVLALLVWWRVLKYSNVFRGLAIALVPVLILGAAVGAMAMQELVRGKSQTEASSSSTRLVQLNAAISAASDSPILGYGQSSALGLAGVSGSGGLLTMDVHYISLLLDSGLVGFVLFIVLAVWMIGRLVAHGINTKGPPGLFACALVAASVSVLVTLSAVAIPQNLYLFFLAFGCLVGLNREKNESGESKA